jgi:hypothetical protein
VGRAKVASVVGMLTVALVATACVASTVSGQGRAAPGASIVPSAPTSADFPTSLPPASSIPVPSLTPTTTAPPSTTNEDITDVKYRIPNGFVKSHVFHPVAPLERQFLSRYLVPSNERRGLDVISILYYTLPGYVHLNTLAQQKARVLDYNRQSGARVTSGPRLTLVDGRPAIQENAIEQRIYRYATWYVFSVRHFVQVSCQVDQQVNKIARGCQAVLKSMKFS